MKHHVVVLPTRYALGDVVYRLVRRVCAIRTQRLTVCCPRAHRVLYPVAADFVDVPEFISVTAVEECARQCRQRWPGADVIEPDNKLPREMELHFPQPLPVPQRPPVIIAPRFKQGRTAHRNWPHWVRLCRLLQQHGKDVLAVGRREMSYPTPCAFAPTVASMAAAIQAAPLVIATDSAAAHLAILFRRPLAVLWAELGVIPGQTYREGAHAAMERQKRAPVHHLVGAWESADLAFELLRPHLL